MGQIAVSCRSRRVRTNVEIQDRLPFIGFTLSTIPGLKYHKIMVYALLQSTDGRQVPHDIYMLYGPY